MKIDRAIELCAFLRIKFKAEEKRKKKTKIGLLCWRRLLNRS